MQLQLGCLWGHTPREVQPESVGSRDCADGEGGGSSPRLREPQEGHTQAGHFRCFCFLVTELSPVCTAVMFFALPEVLAIFPLLKALIFLSICSG